MRRSAPSLFGRAFQGLLRLSIAKKMFLGYGVLAALVVLIALASLTSLERITRINQAILATDVPLTEATGHMVDAVLDQELYARRASILRGEDLTKIFWERGAQFTQHLERARNLPATGWVPADSIAALHADYTGRLAETLTADPADAAAAPDRETRIRNLQEELIGAIKKVGERARASQSEKTVLASQAGARAFRVMAVFCAVAFLFSVISTLVLTRSIARPLTTLKGATERISDGKFDDIPEIRSQDELGDFSRAFSEMARRIKRMEEMYLDASPLTRLPGNIAIENILRKRLETGAPLAFCLIDMDNFKAYNDRYGYARGNELIRAAAGIVERAVAAHGSSDDFVGHIGGDDFAVITTPDAFRPICTAVIREFDAAVRPFYDAEDLARGHIAGKSRQGEPLEFPVTTISIAVVTNTERRLDNPVQVGELAAELKEYAKSLPGSGYVVDRRRKEVAAQTAAAQAGNEGAHAT